MNVLNLTARDVRNAAEHARIAAQTYEENAATCRKSGAQYESLAQRCDEQAKAAWDLKNRFDNMVDQ